ncbi:MAG TPA: hypothetical protein HA264_09375 [Methanolinea sp.]|jgi:hypothetical protein|nr:hypothetical protein [Methanolinea sp.]HNQ29544.1 hypothetical protein [Methanolinea sp.]
MKLTTTCILACLACILVLAAGCTSAPAPAQTPTPTATTVPATPVPIATTASFSGTWNTKWYDEEGEHPDLMFLEQAGSAVIGMYSESNGTINGTFGGSRLVGTWVDYYENETVTGVFEFTLSPDGNSFTGKWADTLEELANATEFWNGVRV